MNLEDFFAYNPIGADREKGRQRMLMLVCGQTGVGKTYHNHREIAQYLRDNPATGKKAGKVLVFDINDHDYGFCKSVSPDYLHALKVARPRRIRPFTDKGVQMGIKEKKEVAYKILRSFRNGLVLLDDIDSYMTWEESQDMISALTTLRHIGVDFILSHQTTGKITRTAFQNCSWLRLHKQVDSVTQIKDRITQYRIVRIAELIVNEQYHFAQTCFRLGIINKAELKRRAGYYVYINMRNQYIRRCSREAFIRACKRYIDQEEKAKVNRMLSERDMEDNPIYPTRRAAIVQLIKELLTHHEECWDSPFEDPILS